MNLCSKILLFALGIGIALTLISGIPVRWIWSSPGGSAYGTGLPLAYQMRYCGGYAPCYWASIYLPFFAVDIVVWLVVASVALFIAAKLTKPGKKRG